MAILNNGSGPAVKRIVYGATLQRHLALGTYSPTLLALLGHELQTGEAAITRTTPRQTAAVIPTITMALLRTVRQAIPFDVAAMQRGALTVEGLHQEQLARRRCFTEGEIEAHIDRFITRFGAGRVLDGLDRYTRPRSSGHANDNGGGDGVMPAQLSL